MADYIDLKHQKLGEGICQKCGENFNELNFATLSLGTKSKSYVLCNNCLSKLQDKAQSFNHENKVDILPQKSEYITEDKKPVNESYHVNELKQRDHESINKIQSSCDKTDAAECIRQDSNGGRQKEFDLDDTATYSLLKAEQRKIAGIYQSVLHSPLWGKGLEAKNIFAENHFNPDDIFHIIFVRFCDVAGYFWATGSISFPLPLDMFGYIKGKNVKKEDSLYYSQKDVFNKYNDRDFSELVETVGKALLDWENKSLLTYSMAAATVYLRSDTEEAFDRIMLILADAALLHRDKPDQEYYDCSWSLWALLAAAIDFNNRYKRLISDQIVSKSKTNNSYKEQSKSENQQHSIFASNQTTTMPKSQKTFNLDDPSTFAKHNAKQIEMVKDYRQKIRDIIYEEKPINESDLVTELKPRDYESVNKKESSFNNADETKRLSQDSNRINQNEFDLDDTATNSLLKAVQQKIAVMYQSVRDKGLKAIINQVVFILSFIFCSNGSWRKFGTYPLDAEGNRIAPIQWKVIEKKFGKRLIVSASAIDARSYNDSDDTVSWRTCTLRKWLNEDFIEKAFSEEERSIIMTTRVESLDNSDEKGSKETSDKVFLLSKSEFRQYFNYDGCSFTPYAEQKAASLPLTNCGSGKTTNRYLVWLRSPGPSDAALVTDEKGHNIEIRHWNINSGTYVIDDKGFQVSLNAGVRPAMWISLF